MPGKPLYPTSSHKTCSVNLLTADNRRFPLWRLVAWVTIAAQMALPLSVASAPAVVAFGQPETAVENKIAAHALSAGNMLSAQQSDKAALNMARSAVTGEIGQSAKRWLDQFGTARLQLNFDERLKFDNSALDLLVPLYESQEALVYTQVGIRNKDDRNTGNIGGGIRTFYGEWMYGLNTFFDNDFTGKNRRAGIGAEAWTHNLKLSANSYLRLSEWRQSRDFADYHERPANGYDLRAEAFLPSHPQLGGKLMYEQYRGDEVALFGKDNRQKDPYAMTTGINYTPIPLLTLGAEHRQGKGGRHDSSVNMQVQYRLGESWQVQTDPSAVAAGRTLAGSRYDLVERNSHIVLDYKKQEIIRLQMPEQLSGKAGQQLTISAQVSGSHAMDRIEWDGAGLTAAGGLVAQPAPGTLIVTLPPYLGGGASNHYTLSATAYDKKGNASNRVYTSIIVSGHDISMSLSRLEAAPKTLAADGVSSSLLTLEIRDEGNQPVSGLGSRLSFDMTPLTGAVLTDIIEDNGSYVSSLSGTQPGEVTLTPVVDGIKLIGFAKTVRLRAGPAYEGHSTFSISQDSLPVGSDFTLLTFFAKDQQGNSIKQLGDRLEFVPSSHAGVSVTAIAEHNGEYTARLSGIVAGRIDITPSIDGQLLSGLGKTVTLRPGPVSEQHSSFITSADKLLADGRESVTLELTPRDEHGNAADVADDVRFHTSLAEGFTQTDVRLVHGVYSASLSGTIPGAYTVTPSLNQIPLTSLGKALTLLPVEVDGARSTFAISRDLLRADNIEAATLTFSANDVNGRAISGLGQRLGFSVSPGGNGNLSDIDVDLSDISEYGGVYTASLRGGNPGIVRVVPSVDGVEITTMAQDLIFSAADVKLKVSVDREVAKVGEQIALTVEATHEDGTPATAVTIDLHSLGATNRQHGPENATLLYGGQPQYEGGVTSSNGSLTVYLTDPQGKGVKTTFEVSSPVGEKATKDIIFTVSTSPDVDKANYYGHMAESINGIKRPRLAVEMNSEGVSFNNESWARVMYQQANTYCTQPSIERLSAAYVAMRAGGWPALPAGSRGGLIWSSTETPISNFSVGVEVITTHDGSRLTQRQWDGTLGLAVCSE